MLRKFMAEFIGTFLLVFLCCGATSFTAGYQGYLGVVGIALIFGLVLTGLYCAIGSISGSHVNPAVSLAMWVTGRLSGFEFALYACAQFLGAIVGGFAMYGLSLTFNADRMAIFVANGYNLTGLAANGYGSAYPFLQISGSGAAVIEVILTFFFVWVFLAATEKVANTATTGLVVGAALTAVHLFGVPLTGASVNPARSFGPALAVYVCKGDATALFQSVVFILSPFIGGLLAAFVYAFLNAQKPQAAELAGPDEQPEQEESADDADESAAVESTVKKGAAAESAAGAGADVAMTKETAGTKTAGENSVEKNSESTDSAWKAAAAEAVDADTKKAD